jgi:3-dehydroquinate dehydratase
VLTLTGSSFMVRSIFVLSLSPITSDYSYSRLITSHLHRIHTKVTFLAELNGFTHHLIALKDIFISLGSDSITRSVSNSHGSVKHRNHLNFAVKSVQSFVCKLRNNPHRTAQSGTLPRSPAPFLPFPFDCRIQQFIAS